MGVRWATRDVASCSFRYGTSTYEHDQALAWWKAHTDGASYADLARESLWDESSLRGVIRRVDQLVAWQKQCLAGEASGSDASRTLMAQVFEDAEYEGFVICLATELGDDIMDMLGIKDSEWVEVTIRRVMFQP